MAILVQSFRETIAHATSGWRPWAIAAVLVAMNAGLVLFVCGDREFEVLRNIDPVAYKRLQAASPLSVEQKCAWICGIGTLGALAAGLVIGVVNRAYKSRRRKT